jgi:hypothetical protein
VQGVAGTLRSAVECGMPVEGVENVGSRTPPRSHATAATALDANASCLQELNRERGEWSTCGTDANGRPLVTRGRCFSGRCPSMAHRRR